MLEEGLIFPGGGMTIHDLVALSKEAEAAGFDFLSELLSVRSFVRSVAINNLTSEISHAVSKF